MIAEQCPSAVDTLNQLLNNEISEPQPQQEQGQVDLTEKVIKKFQVSIQSILDIEKVQFEIINCEHHEKEVPELMRKLIENLETSKTHFEFILNIIRSKSKEEVDEIIKKFRSINVEECYPKIRNGDTSISVVPLNDLFDLVLIDALQEVQKRSENILKEKEKSKEISLKSDDLAQIQILTSKIETINEYFPGLVTLSPENIFSQPKSSPVWTKLYGATEFAEFMDKKALKASLKMFTEMLTIANAMIYQGQKSKGKTDGSDFNKFAGAISGVYYFANKQKAEINSSLYLTDPKMNLTFGLWSLTEKRLVSELMKTRLPPIGFDKCLYVPRLFPAITRESVLDEYKSQTLETFKPNGDHLKPPSIYNKKEALPGLFNKTLYNDGNNRVKIRIISSKPLTITGKRDEFVKAFISNVRDKVLFDKSKSKYKEKFDGVVIHVHGGGFVAMSSGSHRNYLYRWAKSLNMVVFSIDYRLAPEYPFPAGLDDVWQAYNWLINYSESILGIKMEKIVLAGDSAGGNYVTSLALRAIREGVRVPDGLFLCYPALSLNPKDVHPSYFTALDDLVLPSNILKLCLKAYIPEEFKPHMDPFLSPVLAKDDLLSKLPPVTIFTGANDPLHDDSWQFAERLQRLNKEVKLVVYKELPHGFLSFDEMAEYELMIAKTVGRIRELFYSSFLKNK